MLFLPTLLFSAYLRKKLRKLANLTLTCRNYDLMFRLYHAYCEIDGMDRKDSILHGVYLLGKVISWLEKDTPSGQ